MSAAIKSTLTAWERWELASFDADAPSRPGAARHEPVPPPSTLTEEEVAALREAARREGYEAGRTEGYDAGHSEGLKRGEQEARERGEAAAKPLLSAAADLEAKLAAVDQAVAEDLVALALEVARGVIRQELATRPESLVGVVREALGQLPAQHATLRLHPEDASLVRSYAGEQLAHAGHRVVEDGRLARGDLLIDCGGTHLDATVATRWRRVLAELGRDHPWEDDGNAAAETSAHE